MLLHVHVPWNPELSSRLGLLQELGLAFPVPEHECFLLCLVKSVQSIGATALAKVLGVNARFP